MKQHAHRPTFEILTESQPEALKSRLEETLAASRDLVFQNAGHHSYITVAAAHRHFWSPWMAVEMEAYEHGTRIQARFSPHPSVWTGFAMTYLALIVVAFFAVVWAFSQSAIEQTPTALWVVPACAAIAAGMFVSSQLGQRLAREQMVTLREALEEVVHEEEVARRAADGEVSHSDVNQDGSADC